MSVIGCRPTGKMRSGSMRYDGTKLVLTAEQHYLAETDNAADGWVTVITECTQLGLPAIGDTYVGLNDFCTGLYVESITPEQQEDNPQIWDLTVSYSSDVQVQQTGTNETNDDGDGGDGDLTKNPTTKPTLVYRSTRVRKKVLEQDYTYQTTAAIDVLTPKPYANTAGEWFDPPYEEDKYNLVLKFVKNVAAFDDTDFTAVNGCCNSKPWKYNGVTYAPYQARIVNVDGQPQEDNGYLYYAQTVEIEIQQPDWTQKILNQGNYGWIGNDEAQTWTAYRFPDKDGNGIGGKRNLDLLGQPLPDTVSFAAVNPGAAVTITPADMSFIAIGDMLILDPENASLAETVTVTVVDPSSFTVAAVVNAHPAKVKIVGKPVYLIRYPHDRVDLNALNFT